MNPSEWVVVVPSNREVSAARLRAIPDGVDVVVVEDGDTPVRCDRPACRVLDLPFQQRYMGGDFDPIPRGTAACRNFGFYYVWRDTDYNYVVTLDDDVETRTGFLESYGVLGATLSLPTIVGRAWANTIDMFESAPDCFARGFTLRGTRRRRGRDHPYDGRASSATWGCGMACLTPMRSTSS